MIRSGHGDRDCGRGEAAAAGRGDDGTESVGILARRIGRGIEIGNTNAAIARGLLNFVMFYVVTVFISQMIFSCFSKQ